MSNAMAISLAIVGLALLACLHFALQLWLAAREAARSRAELKGFFEPKPGLDEEAQPAPFKYRMPLSLIIYMIFTVTYYAVLLIVMTHYGW